MGKFEIIRRVNDEFQFNLKDSDERTILTSQGYSTKDHCKHGIESVRVNSPIEERYERLVSTNNQLYFNLKAHNGLVIGTSHMYDNESSREADIELLKKIAPDAEIVDLSHLERVHHATDKEPDRMNLDTLYAPTITATTDTETSGGSTASSDTTISSVTTPPVEPVAPIVNRPSSTSNLGSSFPQTDAYEKNSNNWWKYLLPLLGLFLLGFFLWKSCSKQEHIEAEVTKPDVLTEEVVTVDVVTPAIDKEMAELILPNGVKLNAYKGGIEDQLITFLQSDEYKNATNEELKNRWFPFDNIEFKFNSGTELMESSHAQLNNVVEILKYFKDTKVKIGAYTDKIGSEEENLKISGERAHTIKSILGKDGLASQVIEAEGYGEKFAVSSEKAPDSERAHDRIVALRLEK